VKINRREIVEFVANDGNVFKSQTACEIYEKQKAVESTYTQVFLVSNRNPRKRETTEVFSSYKLACLSLKHATEPTDYEVVAAYVDIRFIANPELITRDYPEYIELRKQDEI
jgi:hypothetical protein